MTTLVGSVKLGVATEAGRGVPVERPAQTPYEGTDGVSQSTGGTLFRCESPVVSDDDVTQLEERVTAQRTGEHGSRCEVETLRVVKVSSWDDMGRYEERAREQPPAQRALPLGRPRKQMPAQVGLLTSRLDCRCHIRLIKIKQHRERGVR